MAKNKTVETNLDVHSFLEKVTDPLKRHDCFLIAGIMHKQTGFEPKIWGTSIVGFGHYHYKYISGYEGNAPLVGFSPRSTAIVLYLATDFENKENLLLQLGKHKKGKGCIYIKKLVDIDVQVLITMIDQSIAYIKTMYPSN